MPNDDSSKINAAFVFTRSSCFVIFKNKGINYYIFLLHLTPKIVVYVIYFVYYQCQHSLISNNHIQ